jgi:hypothetical protein
MNLVQNWVSKKEILNIHIYLISENVVDKRRGKLLSRVYDNSRSYIRIQWNKMWIDFQYKEYLKNSMMHLIQNRKWKFAVKFIMEKSKKHFMFYCNRPLGLSLYLKISTVMFILLKIYKSRMLQTNLHRFWWGKYFMVSVYFALESTCYWEGAIMVKILKFKGGSIC